MAGGNIVTGIVEGVQFSDDSIRGIKMLQSPLYDNVAKHVAVYLNFKCTICEYVDEVAEQVLQHVRIKHIEIQQRPVVLTLRDKAAPGVEKLSQLQKQKEPSIYEEEQDTLFDFDFKPAMIDLRTEFDFRAHINPGHPHLEHHQLSFADSTGEAGNNGNSNPAQGGDMVRGDFNSPVEVGTQNLAQGGVMVRGDFNSPVEVGAQNLTQGGVMVRGDFNSTGEADNNGNANIAQGNVQSDFNTYQPMSSEVNYEHQYRVIDRGDLNTGKTNASQANLDLQYNVIDKTDLNLSKPAVGGQINQQLQYNVLDRSDQANISQVHYNVIDRNNLNCGNGNISQLNQEVQYSTVDGRTLNSGNANISPVNQELQYHSVGVQSEFPVIYSQTGIMQGSNEVVCDNSYVNSQTQQKMFLDMNKAFDSVNNSINVSQGCDFGAVRNIQLQSINDGINLNKDSTVDTSAIDSQSFHLQNLPPAYNSSTSNQTIQSEITNAQTMHGAYIPVTTCDNTLSLNLPQIVSNALSVSDNILQGSQNIFQGTMPVTSGLNETGNNFVEQFQNGKQSEVYSTDVKSSVGAFVVPNLETVLLNQSTINANDAVVTTAFSDAIPCTNLITTVSSVNNPTANVANTISKQLAVKTNGINTISSTPFEIRSKENTTVLEQIQPCLNDSQGLSAHNQKDCPNNESYDAFTQFNQTNSTSAYIPVSQMPAGNQSIPFANPAMQPSDESNNSPEVGVKKSVEAGICAENSEEEESSFVKQVATGDPSPDPHSSLEPVTSLEITSKASRSDSDTFDNKELLTYQFVKKGTKRSSSDDRIHADENDEAFSGKSPKPKKQKTEAEQIEEDLAEIMRRLHDLEKKQNTKEIIPVGYQANDECEDDVIDENPASKKLCSQLLETVKDKVTALKENVIGNVELATLQNISSNSSPHQNIVSKIGSDQNIMRPVTVIADQLNQTPENSSQVGHHKPITLTHENIGKETPQNILSNMTANSSRKNVACNYKMTAISSSDSDPNIASGVTADKLNHFVASKTAAGRNSEAVHNTGSTLTTIGNRQLDQDVTGNVIELGSNIEDIEANKQKTLVKNSLVDACTETDLANISPLETESGGQSVANTTLITEDNYDEGNSKSIKNKNRSSHTKDKTNSEDKSVNTKVKSSNPVNKRKEDHGTAKNADAQTDDSKDKSVKFGSDEDKRAQTCAYCGEKFKSIRECFHHYGDMHEDSLQFRVVKTNQNILSKNSKERREKYIKERVKTTKVDSFGLSYDIKLDLLKILKDCKNETESDVKKGTRKNGKSKSKTTSNFVNDFNESESEEKNVKNGQKLSSKKVLTCPMCYLSYKPSHLEKHIAVVHYWGRINRPKFDLGSFICDTCGKSFKYKKNMEAHNRAIHQGKRRFEFYEDKKELVCTTCGYTTKEKRRLENHVSSVHMGQMPFKCEHCDFVCSERTSLRDHMYRHFKPKPVSCAYCSYGCIQKGSMKLHLKKQHGITLDTIKGYRDHGENAEEGRSKRLSIIEANSKHMVINKMENIIHSKDAINSESFKTSTIPVLTKNSNKHTSKSISTANQTAPSDAFNTIMQITNQQNIDHITEQSLNTEVDDDCNNVKVVTIDTDSMSVRSEHMIINKSVKKRNNAQQNVNLIQNPLNPAVGNNPQALAAQVSMTMPSVMQQNLVTSSSPLIVTGVLPSSQSVQNSVIINEGEVWSSLLVDNQGYPVLSAQNLPVLEVTSNNNIQYALPYTLPQNTTS